MAASRGAGVDWESIAKGMVDFVTEFDVPSSVSVDVNQQSIFAGRRVRNIVISDGNTTIANYAFSNTPSLSNIQFPNTLTKINNNAFQSSGIVSITLPDTITTYGGGLFYNCRRLQEVIIEAATPPTFGANMFLNCTALTGIYVPDASVEAYKAASGWSAYASIIKPLSELGGGKRVVINWLGGASAERSAA